jgi:hypothetical protein
MLLRAADAKSEPPNDGSDLIVAPWQVAVEMDLFRGTVPRWQLQAR